MKSITEFDITKEGAKLKSHKTGNTWPEQEAINKWIEKHGIAVEPWQARELSGLVSEGRIKAERELHDKWEMGCRLIQYMTRAREEINRKDILLIMSGEHILSKNCWCNPVISKGEGDG